MINSVNYAKMSRLERQAAFLKALYTLPYFTRLDFAISSGTAKDPQYNAKTKVNADFYLTDIQSNFGEVFTNTTSLFTLSMWQGYQESLINYDLGGNLPTSFWTYEARFNTPVNRQIFSDKQFEFMPRLIPNNNQIYASIKNESVKTQSDTATLLLKGFQRDNNFVDSKTMAKINASLEKPIDIQYFSFTVDKAGQQTHYLENDNTPRLILGFGARNSTVTKADVSTSELTITDTTRQKQWNNEPIPLQFFAPRLTCLLDQHIYWLPIEYWFQPFDILRFDLSNTKNGEDIKGYEFVAITRTI